MEQGCLRGRGGLGDLVQAQAHLPWIFQGFSNLKAPCTLFSTSWGPHRPSHTTTGFPQALDLLSTQLPRGASSQLQKLPAYKRQLAGLGFSQLPFKEKWRLLKIGPHYKTAKITTVYRIAQGCHEAASAGKLSQKLYK